MLELSKRAKNRLHQSLSGASEADLEDKCFRIVPTSHEHFLTLKIDEPREDDATFDHRGRTVLALPKSLQQKCANKRLNVGEQGRLEFA